MTATAPVINNRPQRKLLSEELDRLDSIVDAIADGLPAAVAAAAREGTRQAVKDTIVEIVSNPELRALLQMQTASAAPAPNETITTRPSLWSRIKARIAAAKAAVVRRTRAAKSFAVEACKAFAMVVPVRQIVLVSGVVLLAGFALYFAPAGLSAATGAVAGAMAAAVVQVGNWSRRAARTLMATG